MPIEYNRSRSEIELAVFDVGNTLVNANALIRTSAAYATKRMASFARVRHPARLLHAYLHTSITLSYKHINRIFSDTRICRSALIAARIPATDYNIYRLLTLYRRRLRQRIHPDKRLIKTFRMLKRRHILLCALSDGTTVEQYELLDRLGVLELFDDIIVSETFGEEKISTDVFDHILGRFRISPRRALMVGDDLRRDIFWAHKAGYITALQQEFVSHPTAELLRSQAFIDFRLRSISDVGNIVSPERIRNPKNVSRGV